MAPDVNELFEELQDLQPRDWQELSRKIQNHWMREFRDAQRAYFDRLKKEGLLEQLRGRGGTFQPIPGEEDEWVEYCREHPNDPICLAGAPPAVGDRLSDFLEVREEYLSHLEEEGLVDIEESSQSGGRGAGQWQPMAAFQGNPSPQPSRGSSGSPVGLTPPFPPWPPWPWPPEWPPWPRPPWPPGPGPDPPPPIMEGQFSAFQNLQRASGQGQQVAAIDPRMGYTPAPDGPVWPPSPWPWPWPWPRPRPDPGPWFNQQSNIGQGLQRQSGAMAFDPRTEDPPYQQGVFGPPVIPPPCCPWWMPPCPPRPIPP